MPQATQQSAVAWLLGLSVSPTHTGLVATISSPSTPANDPATRRTIPNVATSARAIATGFTPKHSGMPCRAPPSFNIAP